jgi:hypothetical protein
MTTTISMLSAAVTICAVIGCLYLIYNVVMKKYKGTYTRIAYFIIYSFLLIVGAYYVFFYGDL